jgi:flavin-dependent dehydrogenase
MFDVCIFGAGPAGIATAARLADAGAMVAILDRPKIGHPWVGETFSGAIRMPLTTLRMWDAFCSAGHVQGYEIHVAWGTAEPCASNTIFRPHGHSWHVDRARFDQDLRNATAQRGCVIRPYHKLVDVRCEGAVWEIRLDEGTQLRARFLVDATGRSCTLGRRLGASRRHFDRLVALVARIPRSLDPSYGNAIVVEATHDGWWYAAPVPDAHVIVYLTDSDLVPSLLKHVGLRSVAADSALTNGEAQSGWLPVGDAFAAHDPLCGWGVVRALSNGIRAADAILAFLKTSDQSSLEAYRTYCIDQFARYLEGLTQQYALERRWPTSTFWVRRMRVLTTAV